MLVLMEFIYAYAAGFFAAVVGFYLYYRDDSREKIFSLQVAICILNIVYCMLAFCSLRLAHSIEFSRVTFCISAIVASALSITYLYLIEIFLKKKFLRLKLLLLPLVTFCIIIIFDLVWNKSLQQSWFFEVGLPGEGYQNLFLKTTLVEMKISKFAEGYLGLCGATVTLLNLGILWLYRTSLESEKLLKLGIYATFITQLIDISMGGLQLKYAFPVLFLGYVFEAIRFCGYSINKTLKQKKLLNTHLSAARKAESFIPLLEHLIHDLKGVSRRMEPSSNADDLYKAVSGRIEFYDSIIDTNSFQKHKFTELVEILQISFEDREKQLCLNPEGFNDDFKFNISTSYLYSILYNIVENFYEALDSGYTISKISFALKQSLKFDCLEIISDQTLEADMDEQLFFMKGRSKKGKNRGRGMSLSKSLSGLNGGNLELDSESENIKFILSLPAYAR